MDCEIIEKGKDSLELEFNEKEVPLALVGALTKNGVDAYWYEPHPLKKQFRVHLDSDDPMGSLKKAVQTLDEDWSAFSKALESKLK